MINTATFRLPNCPRNASPNSSTFAPLQGCHLLSVLLEELGIAAVALHSHRPQKARLAALDRFKSGSVPILLATDVASRGLDIPTVDLVVNYDLPHLARDYVHRCASACGHELLLLSPCCCPLAAFEQDCADAGEHCCSISCLLACQCACLSACLWLQSALNKESMSILGFGFHANHWAPASTPAHQLHAVLYCTAGWVVPLVQDAPAGPCPLSPNTT